MRITNLERAAQIAREMPCLEQIRKDLSNNMDVVVGERVLPRSVIPNLMAAVNAEINRLRKEVEDL